MTSSDFAGFYKVEDEVVHNQLGPDFWLPPAKLLCMEPIRDSNGCIVRWGTMARQGPDADTIVVKRENGAKLTESVIHLPRSAWRDLVMWISKIEQEMDQKKEEFKQNPAANPLLQSVENKLTKKSAPEYWAAKCVQKFGATGAIWCRLHYHPYSNHLQFCILQRKENSSHGDHLGPSISFSIASIRGDKNLIEYFM